MQRFTSTLGGKFTALFWLAFLVMALGLLGHILLTPNRMGTPGIIMFSVMSAFFGWMFGSALVAACAVYEVDEDHIARRSITGARSMRWSEVAQYTTSITPTTGSISTLVDSRGQQLTIQWGVIARRSELRALVDSRLSGLHARQQRELGSSDRVYYPMRNGAWATAIMTVLSAVALSFNVGQPARVAEQGAKIGLLAFCGFSLLFFLYMTLYTYSRKLTINSYGIKDQSLFGTKQISFHHVSSLVSRNVTSRNGSVNQTLIEGDGKKITLYAQMPDYDLLVSYIRQQVAEPAREQGQIRAKVLKAKEARQTRILLPIIGLIYFALFAGLSAMRYIDGSERLARYHLMDTRGVTTTGVITGSDTEGSKNVRYLLQFSFKDQQGRERQGVSPVSYADYENARMGGATEVIYVPDTPSICRLTRSIGRQRAEGDLRSAYFLLAVGLIFPPIVVIAGYRQSNRQAAS